MNWKELMRKIKRLLGLVGDSYNGNRVHVVYDEEDDEWKVGREQGSRAYRTFDNKSPAEDKGKEVAENNNEELIIHNKDGRIADKRSYENDPQGIKG